MKGITSTLVTIKSRNRTTQKISLGSPLLSTSAVSAGSASIKKPEQPKGNLVLVADLDVVGDDIGMFEMSDLPPLLGLTADFKGVFADRKIALFGVGHRQYGADLVDEECFANVTDISPGRQ